MALSLKEYMKWEWFPMKDYNNRHEIENILDILSDANRRLPKKRNWNLNDTSRDRTPIKDRVYWDKNVMLEKILKWIDDGILPWRYNWYYQWWEPTVWIRMYWRLRNPHVLRWPSFVPSWWLPPAPY